MNHYDVVKEELLDTLRQPPDTVAFETAVHRGAGKRRYGGLEGSENIVERQTLRAWSYAGLFPAVSVGGRSPKGPRERRLDARANSGDLSGYHGIDGHSPKLGGQPLPDFCVPDVDAQRALAETHAFDAFDASELFLGRGLEGPHVFVALFHNDLLGDSLPRDVLSLRAQTKSLRASALLTRSRRRSGPAPGRWG